MNDKKEHTWLKSKRYLHITAQIDVKKRERELVGKVKSPEFVSKYAFYPLIHTNISERRFKRSPNEPFKRCHSYIENEAAKKNSKSRPLHYATHFDAIIFSYYASLLQEKYEHEICKYPGMSESIIAYRKIPLDVDGKHKSTIHFAKEIFDEIKSRGISGDECAVLTFDIKSFFSCLNHFILKNVWARLLNLQRLPDDHYNIFKASTKFSYIYLDELRIGNSHKGRKPGFNEKELARIRNKHGIHAFFESPMAFRKKVKDGSVKLYKFPFRDKKTKEPCGIPQGLPISAVLANLYLLDFDKRVLEEVVVKSGGYYRRYSDDIVVVCHCDHAKQIEDFILSAIKESKLEISSNKTERFTFKKVAVGKQPPRLTSIKHNDEGDHLAAPFNYLGFEFNGQKALIKSANLAKFYRRMIYSVKRKCKRARKLAEKNPGEKPYIFRRQLYRLYTTKPLHNVKVHKRWKSIEKIQTGEFRLRTKKKSMDLRSNYLTYVSRASEIMKEPAIESQIRKHKKIFNAAINKHLK